MKVPSIAVVTLLFTLCIFSQAQMTGGSLPSGASARLLTLSVTVIDAQNTPTANARVELHDTSNGRVVTSGYTNGMGYLELSGVPAGSYDVTVTHNLSEVQDRLDMSIGDRSVRMRLLPTGADTHIGDSSTVSVAEYKVSGKARNEYNKAQEALQKGKKDDARKHVAKALDIYPNYADALTLRALMSMDSSDSGSAIRDLEAAIKADPAYPTAYFAMGATLNLLNRFDDAIRTLQYGIRLSPQSWQAYFEMGKAEIGKGSYQEGINQLEKAEALNKQKYPALHLVKAHAMLALKQYPGAMQELQAFLTEAPDDSRSGSARAALQQVSAFVGK